MPTGSSHRKLALARHRPELRDPEVLIQVLDDSNPTTAGPKLPVDENGYRRWFDNVITPEETQRFRTNFINGPSAAEQEAFIETINLLHDSGVKVIVVEVPVPDALLALMPSDGPTRPFGREGYDNEVERLRALVATTGAEFFAADPRFSQSEAFVDYDHFTSEAAHDYSIWLGAQVDRALGS